jgi:hypothetical protein
MILRRFFTVVSFDLPPTITFATDAWILMLIPAPLMVRMTLWMMTLPPWLLVELDYPCTVVAVRNKPAASAAAPRVPSSPLVHNPRFHLHR